MGPPRPTPPRTLARPFTLGDLIILIAGLAVGIAWTRAIRQFDDPFFPPAPQDWRDAWTLSNSLVQPVPLASGVTLLVLRLRRPRPTFRRLARQPGATALVMLGLILAGHAAIGLLGMALEPVVAWSTPGRGPAYGYSRLADLGNVGHWIGLPIAGCWLLQALGGRWRPEPSWIDRAGRALGVVLIAYQVVFSTAWAARV